MADVTVRDFQDGDEVAFRTLSEEWIKRWFALEPSDLATMSDPRGRIIDKGGRILMVIADGVAVGCCALIVKEPGTFEIGKMAVTPAVRGTGVGANLMQEAIKVARAMGARRLYLETNQRLTPAIALYKRAGFQHVAQFVSPYARADVAMEMWL